MKGKRKRGGLSIDLLTAILYYCLWLLHIILFSNDNKEMHHYSSLLLFFLSAIYVASVASFCPPQTIIKSPTSPASTTSIFLVTEEDVIKLVEEAEDLWAKAYEARKTANELSEKAEAAGKDAELSTTDAMQALQESISIDKIADANEAQNLSLELGSLLDEVEKAQKEADDIEVLADKALAASEAALEQHLIDFPENA